MKDAARALVLTGLPAGASSVGLTKQPRLVESPPPGMDLERMRDRAVREGNTRVAAAAQKLIDAAPPEDASLYDTSGIVETPPLADQDLDTRRKNAVELTARTVYDA